VPVNGPISVPPVSPEEIEPGRSAPVQLRAPAVEGEYVLRVAATDPTASLVVTVAMGCAVEKSAPAIPATQ
jgi:hypothetical protein